MKTSPLLVTVASSQACMLKTTIMFKEADTVIFWTRTIPAIFAFAEDVDSSWSFCMRFLPLTWLFLMG